MWGGFTLHGLLGLDPGLPSMPGMTLGSSVLHYLLLQVINLRAQPLHHPVQLRDLHPGGAKVIPMLAGRALQLLVLGGSRSRG